MPSKVSILASVVAQRSWGRAEDASRVQHIDASATRMVAWRRSPILERHRLFIKVITAVRGSSSVAG
ncbi:MAG: hypothetical protein ACRDNS_27695, partial [Trebonia sp.]